MSKKMVSMIAVAFLVTAAAYANDAWKDKDFQNWDQKDVQKILTDSPWSKKFELASGGSAGDGSMTRSNSVGSAAGSGTGSSGDLSDRIAAAQREPGQAISVFVSWFSSRTIREAMARNKELAGTPRADARKTLSDEPTTYEVAVSGRGLAVFGDIQEGNLKEHSYLSSRATKEKIAPAEVIVQRTQYDQPVAIIFEFAKSTPSGAPTIAKNERGVEFVTQAGKIPIKIQFDLTKMTDKEGADY